MKRATSKQQVKTEMKTEMVQRRKKKTEKPPTKEKYRIAKKSTQTTRQMI